ncbi:MAG: hypothetical protein IK104_04095 [Clostridia bacterium]|nr:hypothetical protein [Clostridia bacterium]
MALFGKKKKDNEPVPVPSAADEMRAAHQKLEETRVSLDEIADRLKEIRTQPVQAKVIKAAKANESMLKDKAAAAALAESEAKERGGSTFDKSGIRDEELYLTMDDLPVYDKSIASFITLFSNISSADVVATGGEAINPYLSDYVLKLQAALEKGQKLKANACFDALKYAFEVAYTKDDESDPEKLAALREEKVVFIRDTCKNLLDTIDAYYGGLINLENAEKAHRQSYDAFVAQSEKLDEVPPEEAKKIDSLGFKRAMDELPPGDNARKYFSTVMAAHQSATMVLYDDMNVESLLMHLEYLDGAIRELIKECRKAYNLQGRTFNFIEHRKNIESLRNKSLNRVHEMQQHVITASQSNEELISRLNELASNPEMGMTIENNMQTVKRMNALIRKNEQFEQNVSKMRDDIAAEKQRIENERQMRENEEQNNDPILADMG